MKRRALVYAGVAAGASTLLGGGGWVWWTQTGRDVPPFPIEGRDADANARLQLSAASGKWIATITIVAVEAMVLNRWNLPIDGTVDNNVFEFSPRVRYIGTYAKRVPTEADLVKLPMGDSYIGTVELDRYYALPRGEDVSATYLAFHGDHLVRSNAVQFRA
jgi:hypothetical protein